MLHFAQVSVLHTCIRPNYFPEHSNPQLKIAILLQPALIKATWHAHLSKVLVDRPISIYYSIALIGRKQGWAAFRENMEQYVYKNVESLVPKAVAENAINSLPMVKAGLFDVSYMQLGEWTEMSRMLSEHRQSIPPWYPSEAVHSI